MALGQLKRSTWRPCTLLQTLHDLKRTGAAGHASSVLSLAQRTKADWKTVRFGIGFVPAQALVQSTFFHHPNAGRTSTRLRHWWCKCRCRSTVDRL